jgi:hypothetical protein
MCLSSYKSLYYFLIVRIALCLWWFGLYSWVRYQRHYHLQNLQVKIISKHPQIVQSISRTPWMTPCIHYLTLHIISAIMRADPFSTHHAEPHFMLIIMRHLKWTCPHFMLMMMRLLKIRIELYLYYFSGRLTGMNRIKKIFPDIEKSFE